MRAQFLLGPAGSGKTFRCLAEIRAELTASPDGPPLVLLAPKQATFQLERQLLAGGTLAGFTRLHILSFDRLAAFAFDRLNVATPKFLSAEGRVMVLRALLWRCGDDLKLLQSSARRIGFAQELAGQLAELQQHHLGPTRLRALAGNEMIRRDLRHKLLDLALLAEKYTDWQARHDFNDANCLLDVAAEQLKAESQRLDSRTAGSGSGSPLFIEHLWLDGFAEMTPQEHALLVAIAPFCKQATLAFCLETEPTPSASWLSIWSAIGKTFQRCRAQLAAVPGCMVETEIIERQPGKNRFSADSAIGVLEAGWALPPRHEIALSNLHEEISITACDTPGAEAVFAARSILKFVRNNSGARFRDCAVLVRDLERYHYHVARVFRRYEIPFFLDRRENVAHHPLAELTRNALRTVANDWQHDDWFSALKSGFTTLAEAGMDRLENQALEHGWRGKKWREKLPDEGCETLRQSVIAPFEALFRRLQRHKLEPTGVQLAEAIRELWSALKVEATLEQWSLPDNGGILLHTALHTTVHEQMLVWLENVAMAFPGEKLALRDWLPILDAGLAGLTVGVIPPALDEVLVGAIDRARNPELKLILLLGVNDSVFPASPAMPAILTNSDREELDRQSVAIGPNLQDQISRERYLGYIACTRASQKLALTYAHQDAGGRALNPSPLVDQLRRMFPQLEIQEYAEAAAQTQPEHAIELAAAVLALDRSAEAAWSSNQDKPGQREWMELMKLPSLQSLREKLLQLREPSPQENLSPALAGRIYGSVLKSSVSRLEEFSQCPFRFFVHSGLRAEERKLFELDARERGSFQHEILSTFHDELVAEKKRWRDITPEEARQRIDRIAGVVAKDYREGLLRMDDRSRFTARMLTVALQNFVETLVLWMREQYGFDPVRAETGFGLDDPGLPAWKIELGGGQALALRGRVDRIDLCDAGDHSLAVVMDYKSSDRKLDKVLVEHGIQLQLLAYLAVVRRWPADFFAGKPVAPAGVFYVNLRGQYEGGGSRTEVLAEAQSARRLAYRHKGRFNSAYLDNLDRQHARDQFNYMLNKDGSVRSNSAEALPGGEFEGLLDQVEAQLKTIGQSIYAGSAAVDPYRKGSATACEYCDYRPVCRIDEWTHEFRQLRAAAKSSGESDET